MARMVPVGMDFWASRRSPERLEPAMMPGERGDGVRGSRASAHTRPRYPHAWHRVSPGHSRARLGVCQDGKQTRWAVEKVLLCHGVPSLLFSSPSALPPHPKPQSEATQGLGSKALKCLVSLALN